MIGRLARRAALLGIGILLAACAGCGGGSDGPSCPTCPEGIVLRPDGSGDYPTIQAAIDAADSLDTILLGDGVYRGEGNRNLLLGGKILTIRSLSGDPSRCIVDCEGTEEEPRWGIVYRSAEDGAILSNVTIGGASAGAVHCDGASVNLIGCRFLDNVGMVGGAVSCTGGGVTVIRDCHFEGNRAQAGGAIFCQHADPWITGCLFAENEAAVAGGAIAGQSASPAIRTCDFFGNRSGGDGGALSFLYGSPLLADLLVEGNRADRLGGGILVEDGSAPRIERCLLFANEAASSAGLHAAGPCAVERCTIAGNVAADFGGGCGFSGPVTASECTIVGNVAPSGSGIVVAGDASLELARTIVAFGLLGEAIRVFGEGAISIVCCDLYANEGGDWVGEIADRLGVDGNISADPLFCGDGSGGFALRADSPCLGGDCGRIGAWEQGCLPPSPIRGPRSPAPGSWRIDRSGGTGILGHSRS